MAFTQVGDENDGAIMAQSKSEEEKNNTKNNKEGENK